jgi:aminopeptidase N
VAGVRNLTQAEAAERAGLLEIDGYDIALDLTDGAGGPGEGTFRSTTTIQFRCARPGAASFVEVAADSIRSATLNGAPVDISGWSADQGLALTGLEATNELVVDADFGYSTSGQGMHRSVDPVDGGVYLYSQFETTDAQRVFACFDQPDLKSVYTWHATVPAHWRVVSNMPVDREEPLPAGGKTVHFGQSVPMSTYVTALCAGPYHEVREQHDGIDLGLLCRASMARHLDAAEVFEITRQGFDFFHRNFGVRYPLAKYDQVVVPEFNALAMENFGCVTNAEPQFVFRSAVTDAEYEQRANVILHEMAHMWFGDLVTMRWWNDLWLNESFAEWASHWCNSEATRFSDAWSTFLSVRKNWGYRQDQLSSTHPVYTEMPDVASVEVNFDGITYAKGASVLKQLVAYVGMASFLAGLRAYFGKYAWGNATFDDLLTELEAASGLPLRKFAAQWLETAQVNTLRPIVEIGPDGRYLAVAVRQDAPAEHPTLRTHRIGVGLYDVVPAPQPDGPAPHVDGERLVRRRLVEVTVDGERTELPELAGLPAADVLLLNDEDLTYAKLRLDEGSLQTVVRRIGSFDSALARSLCWTAAWDMLRDAELPARDYLALVLAGLPSERDITLVGTTLRQAAGALTFYADPAWAPTGWAALARAARGAVELAEPGSGFQLAWARAYISAARADADLAELRGWLDGTVKVPAGLTVDSELRWALVQALVAGGAVDESLIDAELDADRTANGEREAAQARALVPTPEAKAAVWRQITGPDPLPNWQHRALLVGFQHPAQRELTEPYVAKFLDVVGDIWARRDNEPAQEFAVLGYPSYQVSERTVVLTDAWLAADGHPAPLRRLLVEGKDGVVRALRARAADRAR